MPVWHGPFGVDRTKWLGNSGFRDAWGILPPETVPATTVDGLPGGYICPEATLALDSGAGRSGAGRAVRRAGQLRHELHGRADQSGRRHLDDGQIARPAADGDPVVIREADLGGRGELADRLQQERRLRRRDRDAARHRLPPRPRPRQPPTSPSPTATPRASRGRIWNRASTRAATGSYLSDFAPGRRFTSIRIMLARCLLIALLCPTALFAAPITIEFGGPQTEKPISRLIFGANLSYFNHTDEVWADGEHAADLRGGGRVGPAVSRRRGDEPLPLGASGRHGLQSTSGTRERTARRGSGTSSRRSSGRPTRTTSTSTSTSPGAARSGPSPSSAST